jgi:hypothetical protein
VGPRAVLDAVVKRKIPRRKEMKIKLKTKIRRIKSGRWWRKIQIK